MPETPRNFGLLSTREKQELLKQALKRRGGESLSGSATASVPAAPVPELMNGLPHEPDEATWQVEKFPAYQQLLVHRATASHMGVDNPFFISHEGRVGATTTMEGRNLLNFSNYNYLGLNDDPRVLEAAKAALDRYGVSAAASRVVSGERPVHRALEERLAALHGTEDAVAFVSGFSTNVTTIGSLMGSKDLILHDRLIHNSAIQGALLSGAARIPYPHNDMAALREILASRRAHHEKVLVVAEGIYSMDGDVCPLDRLLEIKHEFRALLLVDEAHSIGVLGSRGRGVGEHFGIAGKKVDLWMGTLSKTLSGCGGYIAGSSAMVELLKFTAPGFVYSVGMAPALAAASRTALDCMLAEPERVETLRANGRLFLELARQHGLNVGLSQGFNIVPVITGRSVLAARLSNALLKRGVNAAPIIYPAVEERAARLRFFLSSAHSADQIREAVAITAEELRRLSQA
jgi:8-amino-7-oxononanoate synthase